MRRDPRAVREEDRIRLTHMLESARRTLRITDGMNLESLEKDEVRLLAVVKSIEVIGEACTKVSEGTCSRLTRIDWRGIRSMRNRMIHGYDTIDTAIVWTTVVEYIPLLVAELEGALEGWPAD